MVLEAAWNPNGTVAINRTRFPEALAQVQKECPERLKSFQSESSSGNESASITSDNLNARLAALQHYAPETLTFNDSGTLNNP